METRGSHVSTKHIVIQQFICVYLYPSVVLSPVHPWFFLILFVTLSGEFLGIPVLPPCFPLDFQECIPLRCGCIPITG